LVATSTSGGTIALFDPDTGAREAELTSDGGSSVQSIAGITAAGHSHVAVGYSSGLIRILDPRTGDLSANLVGHTSTTQSLAWAIGANGRLLLASGSDDETVRVWDAMSAECLATLPCHTTVWDLGWAVLGDERLLLAANGPRYDVQLWDPVRGVMVAQVGSGGDAAGIAVVSLPHERGVLLAAAGTHEGIHVFRLGIAGTDDPAERATRASGPSELESLVAGAVRLGEWGLWASLGLLGDLINLLDPTANAGRIRSRLNNPALAELMPDPVLTALRGLGWLGVRARLGLAGLVIAALEPVPGLIPPAGTSAEERATALLRALAAGEQYRGAAAGAAELRRALANTPTSVLTLLDLVGEEAVATDPGLPVRLVTAAAGLPVMGRDALTIVSRSVRQMEHRGSWLPPDWPSGGFLELSRDPVDRDLVPVLARRGRPDRMVPTHLALPERVRVPLQATGGLLFRHHADPPDVMLRPVAVVLDVSPAVFGPVEVVLRLVAHLLTVMVWQAGGEVSLVTTARPRVVVPLEQRRDLVSVWTMRSLDAPDLHAAVATATQLDQPMAVLTHHATAVDQGLRPRPGLAVVTTYTPVGPVPPEPTGGYHRLPPRLAPDELTALLDSLLDFLSEPEIMA